MKVTRETLRKIAHMAAFQYATLKRQEGALPEAEEKARIVAQSIEYKLSEGKPFTLEVED